MRPRRGRAGQGGLATVSEPGAACPVKFPFEETFGRAKKKLKNDGRAGHREAKCTAIRDRESPKSVEHPQGFRRRLTQARNGKPASQQPSVRRQATT